MQGLYTFFNTINISFKISWLLDFLPDFNVQFNPYSGHMTGIIGIKTKFGLYAIVPPAGRQKENPAAHFGSRTNESSAGAVDIKRLSLCRMCRY
jgi:hypothetical protein